MGARMPTRGEKGLLQEGSSSGIGNPNHKADSFSVPKALEQHIGSAMVWAEVHTLLSPLQQLWCSKEPLQVLKCSLSFVANVNIMQTPKHSPLALGGRFLHITCRCAVPWQYFNKNSQRQNGKFRGR